MNITNFGKNLKYLRDKKGLKQSEMLDLIGFKQTTWNGYENQKSFPKFEDLVKISKYFDISETDLIHKNIEKEGFSIQEKPKVSFDVNLELLMMQKEKIARLEIELEEARETNQDKSKPSHTVATSVGSKS